MSEQEREKRRERNISSQIGDMYQNYSRETPPTRVQISSIRFNVINDKNQKG